MKSFLSHGLFCRNIALLNVLNVLAVVQSRVMNNPHLEPPLGLNNPSTFGLEHPFFAPYIASLLSKWATSASLPFLPAHGNQPIEKLIPQNHGCDGVMITLSVDNLQTVRDLS